MSYRQKLLVLFILNVVLVTAAVATIVSLSSRRAFERLDSERSNALVRQFRHEFDRRGEEITRRIESVGARDSTLRMAADLARARDTSAYVNEAATLASAMRLDCLEFVAADGAIISSAQWPARFGYKEDWLLQPADWTRPAFLKREELPEGPALVLVSVRTVQAGDSVLFIVGGERLNREFLSSLTPPSGMRPMLYRATGSGFQPQALMTPADPVVDPGKLAGLIGAVEQGQGEVSAVVNWTHDPAQAESVHALPLYGREGEVLAVLLVANSRREIVNLESRFRTIGIMVGGGGILLGVVLSGWAAARVTQPVEMLADAAREVTAGNWWAQVPVSSWDELGQLAEAFNRMTQELGDQRQKLVQAERVAAWRELARRLAHELKNPMFPLQITVENLVRAREQAPEQFDEVFSESTKTLLAELANLKAIIGRFSDFAKMPAPQLQPVVLNDVVTAVIKLLEPQLTARGKPPITLKLELDPGLPIVQADPELLHRAIQNLLINAIDAMAGGGELTVRTSHTSDSVHLEVSDTGCGLTGEECDRLFTPYYTTKPQGTGLGLAIVQSVVSDHRGTIAVESEAGRGSTFRIELPRQLPQTVRARGANV